MSYSHYPTPPPGYEPFSYPHHGTTPPPNYYSPRYTGPTATPSPHASPKVSGHHRRSSHAVPPQYSYTSPRGGAPFYPEYSTPRQYATPRRDDFVSGSFGYVRPGRYRHDSDATPLKRSHRERKHSQSKQKTKYVHTRVVFDEDGYYDYVYNYPPPPYEQYQRYDANGYTDHYYYDQVPIFTDAEHKSSRPRRASHSGRSHQTTPKRPSTAKAANKATEEDARRAGIPAGYSFKNWDPTEEPIMLLGSVFDANSLGKWIYDWTVYHYGPATPLAEMAGELWLLLIQLAGKVKKAEETMPKIRKKESREMVEDFLESGERLWIRFAKLLKICEDFMWKAAKKLSGEKKPVSMGQESGNEFVDTIFGRDRQLEKTEKLMTGMRLWSMRFDANCEDILRYPSA